MRKQVNAKQVNAINKLKCKQVEVKTSCNRKTRKMINTENQKQVKLKQQENTSPK